MTPRRKEINKRVAKHLQEALTWCFKGAATDSVFNPIRDSEDHDQMVINVRAVVEKVFASSSTT